MLLIEKTCSLTLNHTHKNARIIINTDTPGGCQRKELAMKAEQQNIKRLLNTAKGQIDGLNKMIDDDKYCIDISNQIMATIAILKKVNIEILDAHLKCCVLHADDRERETKINEISEVLKKALK